MGHTTTLDLDVFGSVVKFVGIDELIEVFGTEMRELIDRIAESVEARDVDTVVAASHQLKGASGTLGASHLYEIAMALHSAAKDGDIAGAPDAVVTLRTALTDVLSALEQERQRLSGS